MKEAVGQDRSQWIEPLEGEDRLWLRIRESGDTRAQKIIAEHYYPHIKRMAKWLGDTKYRHSDVGDLEGYGALGLMDAISSYDPEHGTPFFTYMYGAVLSRVEYGVLRTEKYWAAGGRERERSMVRLSAMETDNEGEYRGEVLPDPDSADPAEQAAVAELFKKYTTVKSFESQVLLLRFKYGLSNRQMAERFGCSRQTIDNYFDRAVEQITQPKLNHRPTPPKLICAISDCNGEYQAAGLCSRHLQIWRKHGRFDNLHIETPKLCSMPHCAENEESQGYCSVHLANVKKFGRPQGLGCLRPGCNNEHWKDGFCQPCHQLALEHGIIPRGISERLKVIVKEPEIKIWRCEVKGCPSLYHYAKGLCSTHYRMFKRWKRQAPQEPYGCNWLSEQKSKPILALAESA